MSAPDINVTHAALVKAAAVWLKRKCSVVITELVTTGEAPDAIGWQGTHSTLIECKASRADFLADRDKVFRREPWLGIGLHRYYLAPSGLLDVAEIPAKWGLLELTACGICVTRKSEHFGEVNSRHEIGLLLSTLRRVGHNAPKTVSIRCYTIESKNTATLGLCSDERNDGSAAGEVLEAARSDSNRVGGVTECASRAASAIR
jgi:hypothetical protein